MSCDILSPPYNFIELCKGMFSREKNNLLFSFLRRPSLKREVGVWGHTAPNAHKSAKFSILLAPVSVGVCLWTVRGMNSVALKFKCWQVMWACCARFMNVLPQCCLSDWMTINPLRIFLDIHRIRTAVALEARYFTLYILNKDICLTQTHGFASEGLY